MLETITPAESLRRQFLEHTGYGDRDIVVFNPSTRIFLTRNGGRYQMTDLGKVLHLAGPSPDPTERM
jgi:hypothetical protein